MTNKFGALQYIVQYCRALFWNAIKRIGLTSPCETLEDQQKDVIAPFDEFPSCEMCGGVSTAEILITKDGCHIVQCNDCGLWFTSPRIKEQTWVEYLKRDTERSREFTENRLKYGVALSPNVKYSFPDWRKRRMKRENHIIDEIERHLSSKISRLHDVGCGVGFLLEAAQSRGIEATGNDLNGYACRVMKERSGLRVYNDILPALPLQEGSLDAVVMNDYIEHTYHPFEDLKAAHRFLRPGGMIWIETFHVDCHAFDLFRENWNMLFWNHVFHFSTKSLEDMIMKAGFHSKVVSNSYDAMIIRVIAQKTGK
jgi:2-polyprenyl-3-methyl-5-hydroxy-6-metoxy-1,4-benzoquinol methylase